MVPPTPFVCKHTKACKVIFFTSDQNFNQIFWLTTFLLWLAFRNKAKLKVVSLHCRVDSFCQEDVNCNSWLKCRHCNLLHWCSAFSPKSNFPPEFYWYVEVSKSQQYFPSKNFNMFINHIKIQIVASKNSCFLKLKIPKKSGRSDTSKSSLFLFPR